jgi:hypothetical protein
MPPYVQKRGLGSTFYSIILYITVSLFVKPIDDDKGNKLPEEKSQVIARKEGSYFLFYRGREDDQLYHIYISDRHPTDEVA